MKGKRTSIPFIALLLAGCATLTTQIIKETAVVAQPLQTTYTYTPSFDETGSELPLQSTLVTAYFVAPDGDNDNPGTEGLPWRTIQKAANTLVAGEDKRP